MAREGGGMSLWRSRSDLDKILDFVDPMVYAYCCHSLSAIDLHPSLVVWWICVSVQPCEMQSSRAL